MPLTDAYGPGSDALALVAALRAPDAAARADAAYWLRACLCHQGTRTEASAAALPALVAHAADPHLPDRPAVLDLLADLAVGDADRWLLGAADPQAADPVARGLVAGLRAWAPPHHDATAAVRARAARLAHVVGGPVPAAADPDPAVRACRVLAGAAADPADADPGVVAARAFTAGDVAAAAAVAAAHPAVSPGPWLGGDPVALALAVLARRPADPAAREALAAVVEAGDLARALAAAPSALAGALDHLPPRGGFAPPTLPPHLARLLRALVARPALLAPATWAALARCGVAATDVPALAALAGLPPPPTLVPEPWRETGRRLGVGGPGGPTLVTRLDGATLQRVTGAPRRSAPHGRAAAVRALALQGAAAVPLLVGLAEEADVGLEDLLPAVTAVVAADPDGVAARSLALGRARREPRVDHLPRGTVVHHGAQLALLALHTRATAARGSPPDPALDPLAAAGLEDDVFHTVTLEWVDALPPDRRLAWALGVVARARGRLLQRAVEVLPDDALTAALPALDPGLLLGALAPRRVPALAPALAARIEGFLAERRRWLRDRVGEEVARVASAARDKGPAAVRALRAAGVPGLEPPAKAVAPAPAAAPVAVEPAFVPADGADLVSRAAVELVLAEPLLGWLIGRLERSFTTETPTMGLRIRPQGRLGLLVNPAWFRALAPRVRAASLRHEVLHLVFGHPFRTDLAHVDLGAYGTAADLVVNGFAGRWPLPPDARRHPWSTPPLDEAGGLEELYRALLERRFAEGSAPEAVWHSDHRFWRGGTGAGDMAEASARWDGYVADGVRALGGDALWGLDPGVRSSVLGSAERHRSGLDWRRVLRAFAASSRRTTLFHTTSRRSRRYGTFPGLRIRRHHRLAVAIDTSGSVDDDVLRTFFAEVAAMRRAGSEIVVVECDAAVQRAWEYGGQLPEEVHGRGGTAFEPVMRWLREPHVGRFDGLVYLTDGHGPAPETPPPCPALWVVTPDGSVGEHLRFGPAIRIPPGG